LYWHLIPHIRFSYFLRARSGKCAKDAKMDALRGNDAFCKTPFAPLCSVLHGIRNVYSKFQVNRTIIRREIEIRIFENRNFDPGLVTGYF
jgi:hypothetical protein